MERGTRDCSTLDELREDYGIQVFPIVTVREVIDFLHNNPVDGKIYIDDEMKARMEAYLAEYGAESERKGMETLFSFVSILLAFLFPGFPGYRDPHPGQGEERAVSAVLLPGVWNHCFYPDCTALAPMTV